MVTEGTNNLLSNLITDGELSARRFSFALLEANQEAALKKLTKLTTFYNSGADGGNFMHDPDVCSRPVCSEAQSGNSRCDKSC